MLAIRRFEDCTGHDWGVSESGESHIFTRINGYI